MFMVFVQVDRDIAVSDGQEVDDYSVRVIATSEVVEYIPNQVEGAAVTAFHHRQTHHIRIRDSKQWVEAVKVFFVSGDDLAWHCHNLGTMIRDVILPQCEAMRKAKLKKGGK